MNTHGQIVAPASAVCHQAAALAARSSSSHGTPASSPARRVDHRGTLRAFHVRELGSRSPVYQATAGEWPFTARSGPPVGNRSPGPSV